MFQLVLGIGSNQGDREAWMQMAREEIERRIGAIRQSSPLVESEPWGYVSSHWFLNQTLLVQTALSPKKVLAEIFGIESGFGRIRTGQYADRPVDIDILFYAEQVLALPGLQIPHPKIPDRLFVLLPLAEMIPAWVHPVSGKTIRQLLDDCPDRGICRWYDAAQSSDLLP